MTEHGAGSNSDTRRVLQLVERLLAERDPKACPEVDFLGAQFDFGLAWVHFPVGHGGLGLAPGLQSVVRERLSEAGAPDPVARNLIGCGMAAPTIVTHGNQEQKVRYLRPLFTGEEIWCQLFSEPGAGSDVASVATRAVRERGEWLINGQKVWTTLGHVARWGLLLARTDPDVPKHAGMTYFVMDMHATGVEVKPLFQMTGDAEFNEVFFTDVRLDDRQRVGDPGHGWRVVLTTLMNERIAFGSVVPARNGGLIGEAMKLWRERGEGDPVGQEQLMRLWVAAEVLRLTTARAESLRALGIPGPENSISKLYGAELNKRIFEFVVDLMGAEGMLYPGGYSFERPQRIDAFGNPQRAFLRSRANSIEGGTSEIMKSILGERLLGLPGEPRVDKEVPWSRVPRS